MSQPRDYLFLGQTTSMCEECLQLVPAKIISRNGNIFYQKRCPTHGSQKVLISDDPDYYQRCKNFIKPGDRQRLCQTRIDRGCPYDCGLCPDHEQHSCLAIIEIIEKCNLSCPVCFADSGPKRDGIRSLKQIEAMLDTLVASEGEPDLLQISGGEPTLHPQLIEIIRLARSRPIRHIMLNTNGIRLAQDRSFVSELAEFTKGFEVYLQFDSLQRAALEDIRGCDLRNAHLQALEHLEEAGISTTLVCTLKHGVNDTEIGAIIEHALGYSCIRGVTFQAVQDCGRNEAYHQSQRMVLSQIRRAILEQSDIFTEEDLIPLPCNPESICIGYGLRNGRQVAPVTRFLPRDELLRSLPNSISFEQVPEIRSQVNDVLSMANVGEATETTLQSFLCCLPKVAAPEGLGYESVFRIAIIQFLDRHNFCLANVKRSCIHFVTEDGRIIPFDTYNLLHRAGP